MSVIVEIISMGIKEEKESERIISVKKISEYFKNRDKIYLIMLAGFVLRLLFILLDNNFDFLPYDWDTT